MGRWNKAGQRDHQSDCNCGCHAAEVERWKRDEEQRIMGSWKKWATERGVLFCGAAVVRDGKPTICGQSECTEHTKEVA